jgi:hypothetical protein
MRINTRIFSCRFAEQVLNSKLSIKQEIDSTKYFSFSQKGWKSQPAVFGEQGDPTAKMDFLKKRVGIGVEFGHSYFIGIDVWFKKESI